MGGNKRPSAQIRHHVPTVVASSVYDGGKPRSTIVSTLLRAKSTGLRHVGRAPFTVYTVERRVLCPCSDRSPGASRVTPNWLSVTSKTRRAKIRCDSCAPRTRLDSRIVEHARRMCCIAEPRRGAGRPGRTPNFKRNNSWRDKHAWTAWSNFLLNRFKLIAYRPLN